MDIYVSVANQKLKIATNLKNLVAGTKDFIRFIFELTDDWQNLHPFVQFKQNDTTYNQYLDEEDSAYLPAEITSGPCTMTLYGSNGKTVATTNYITLQIDDSRFIVDANSTDITPPIYEQIMEKFDKLLEADYVTETVRSELQRYIDDGRIGSLLIADGSIKYAQLDDNLKNKVDKQGSAIVMNQLPSTGDSDVDYYIPSSGGGYTHYRWINEEFVSVGSDTYTKEYIDVEIQNVENDIDLVENSILDFENDISALSSRISSNTDAINELVLFINDGDNYESRISALESAIDDLQYKPITVNSFTVSPNLVEKGSSILAFTYSYSFNKIPATLRIDGEVFDPVISGSEDMVTMDPIIQSTTFTLVATDNGSSTNQPASVTKTATMTFANRVYYGVSEIPEQINDAFLKGLQSTLSNTRARTLTLNVTSGKYAWYALPSQLGTCNFNVGGFDGGFTKVAEFSHTNNSGHSETYHVYRSDNPSLDSIKVVIS